MRRTALIAGLLGLAACQDIAPTDPSTEATPAAAFSAAEQGPLFVPGELVVKLRDGADAATVVSDHGLALGREGYARAFVVLRGAAGSEQAIAARLRADARVVYAEPNWLRQPTIDPDPRLWAFHNPGGLSVNFTRGRSSGQPVGSYLSVADADVDAAGGDVSGSIGAGGAPVVIGSIDTGVQFGHPEFGGRLIAGRDWYSNDDDPSDEDGHGTHTTGTAAGATVGVAGVTGAAANISVYVQRVCGPFGCPTSATANAIRAAADYPGMVAMNLSLGGAALSQAEHDAILYATSKNVLVIASAGNSGTSTVECPACDPNAISVAALNWQDELAYYSNWGSGLDLSAPGGELYSNTTSEAGIYSAVPGGYAYMQGTSMAAPVVTGAAAVVASVTGARGAALRSRLEGDADDLGSSGTDDSFGHGRVNVYAAIFGSSPGGGGGGGDTGGGSAPTAAFSFSCGGNSTCSFDASASTGATNYAWDFDDGGTASGVTASHTFQAGSWLVTLTVSNDDGSATAQQTVDCAVKGKSLKCR